MNKGTQFNGTFGNSGNRKEQVFVLRWEKKKKKKVSKEELWSRWYSQRDTQKQRKATTDFPKERIALGSVFPPCHIYNNTERITPTFFFAFVFFICVHQEKSSVETSTISVSKSIKGDESSKMNSSEQLRWRELFFFLLLHLSSHSRDYLRSWCKFFVDLCWVRFCFLSCRSVSPNSNADVAAYELRYAGWSVSVDSLKYSPYADAEGGLIVPR